MIEFISGKVAELTAAYAVIDCGGVGYYANISLYTFEELKDKETARLYIHEAIREDAYVLYGFATPVEREVFRALISVSGVGAASGRLIVSAMTPAELKNVIMAEDVATLKSIKGLGLKTAQRIIVELKDKIEKIETGDTNWDASAGSTSANKVVREEALQALEVLGYSKTAAAKVVDKLLKENPELKVEGIVKAAFRLL